MPLREAAFERPACEHGGMRRIVIAPDAFKGSITARDAALALAEGWRSIRADDALLLVPQADGGEGTLEAVAAGRPDAQWRTATVAGPLGDPHTARWLLLPGAQAVVELAESCGITLLPRASDGSPAFAPLAASTRGLGETIAAALDAGARGLTIALGGSASTDGGLGALAALGLGLRDSAGAPLDDGGGAVARLAAIDEAGLRDAPPLGVTLLVDTTARLTGPDGAAAVFGPQKGAAPADIALLDDALARAAALAGGSEGEQPGAGAAGGTAWGFRRFWGASIRSGAEAVAAITALDQALEGADLVITGEGRFDATSLHGKVVGSVVERAGGAGVEVAVVAGQADAAAIGERRVVTLAGLAGSAAAALADPRRWLRDAGAELARTFAG